MDRMDKMDRMDGMDAAAEGKTRTGMDAGISRNPADLRSSTEKNRGTRRLVDDNGLLWPLRHIMLSPCGCIIPGISS
jgi:hypothetical protein